MKNRKLSIIIYTVIFVGLLSCQKQPKTAYVIMNELFKGFEAKKELEATFFEKQKHQSERLDSLKEKIILLSGKEKIAHQKQYNQLLHTYEQENQQTSQKYDKQIWLQINKYLKEYGIKHHYQYIYGADGSGTIMYADSSQNITKEVLHYLNKKYQGE